MNAARGHASGFVAGLIDIFARPGDFKVHTDVLKGMIEEVVRLGNSPANLALKDAWERMESTVNRYLAEGSGVVLHLAASLDGDVAPDKLLM